MSVPPKTLIPYIAWEDRISPGEPLEDGVFAARVSVSEAMLIDNPGFFLEYVKPQLMHKFAEQMLPRMLETGEYHVLKFDLVRYVDFAFEPMIHFGLKVHHSIAHQQHIRMPVMPEDYSVWQRADPACLYCGNVLQLDGRGACSACGAPPGRSQ